MTATELFQTGELTNAVAACNDEIRNAPDDITKRAFSVTDLGYSRMVFNRKLLVSVFDNHKIVSRSLIFYKRKNHGTNIAILPLCPVVKNALKDF